MVNIGIIENDASRLQELKHFINLQAEFICTCTAPSAGEFLAMPLQADQASVILMGITDTNPDKMVGNQIRIVKQKLPDSAIIVLSDVDQINEILDTLRAGAVGYLQKNACLLLLKEVIQHILAGDGYLSPSITRKIADYFRLEEHPELYALTNREKQIVICLTEGFSYKLIAFNLGLSLDTVRFHLRNIYRKLQVNSKAEVIAKVMKREFLMNA